MKFFLVVLLLSALTYGGYIYYKQSTSHTRSTSSPVERRSSLILAQTTGKLDDLASVLGESISSTFENGKEMLSNATNGASEPIINQLVTNTTEALKDLPRREADKIKYEFCKGVVTEYETAKSEKGVTP